MKSIFDKIYFFAAICANLAVFAAVFGGYSDVSVGASRASDPVLLAFNLLFGIATLLLAFPKIPQILFLLGRLRIVLALYLLASVSVLWSTDRAATFRNVVYLVLYLIAAGYIALRFDREEIVRLLGWFMTILAIASIPANFILPPDPYQPDSWKGVFLQKNELGIAMTVGITALIMAEKRWNLVRVCSLATCGGLLLLSRSMTAIIAAAVTIAVITYLRLSSRLSILVLTAIAGAAITLSLVGPDMTGTFSSTTGRDLTLTGRTVIWGLVAKKIVERPVLGYGYGAFWSTEAESVNEFLNGFKPGQAHNGYLEVCLDLGALGLVFVGLVTMGAVRRALRLRRRFNSPTGNWMLVMVVLLLVHNVAESDFMLVHAMWFIFIVTHFSSYREDYELQMREDLNEISMEEQELVTA